MTNSDDRTLEQNFTPSETLPRHLQVDTDQATSFQSGRARQSTMLLWITVGFAGFAIIGMSAWAVLPPPSNAQSLPDSTASEGPAAKLAFTPIAPVFRPGGLRPVKSSVTPGVRPEGFVQQLPRTRGSGVGRSHGRVEMAASGSADIKGYFSLRDVVLVKRNENDVAAFHEKERKRWRDVYDAEYKETPQDFYVGDRVKVVTDVEVLKGGKVVIENADGMQGVVTNYDFDDGYESCQTCGTSVPVTVLLDYKLE